MKRLILSLLILIFSAQSMGAAVGINVLNASQAFSQFEVINTHADVSVALAADISPEMDHLKVFSIDEELSDYVVLEPGLPSLRHPAPSITFAVPIPASIILPTALPPPRS